MDRGVLYDAIQDEGAFAELPATVARLTGGRSATLYKFDAAGALADLRYSYFSAASIETILADRDRRLDTWGNVGFASGITGRAIAMDDLLPEANFRRSGLWNEVLKPIGDDTGHCMGIVHHLEGGMLCVAVQRPFGVGVAEPSDGRAQAGKYSRAETDALDSIVVDLQRIYLTRDLIGTSAARINGLERLLDAGQEALLLMSKDLSVIEASARAREMLGGGAVRLSGRQLRFEDARLGMRVRRAVDDTLNRHETAKVTFAYHDPVRCTTIRLVVLPVVLGESTGCAIRLRIEGEPLIDEHRWLAQHFCLTPAEISVAEALANGLAPDDIASSRGVSLNTVRTQVRQALQKTGCETVARLGVLMRSLP